MENLINLLFPPKCLFCNTLGYVFCPRCLARCPTVLGEQRLFSGLSVFSCFKYKGEARACVRYAKYSSRQFLGLKKLAEVGVKKAKATKIAYVGFVVCAIPLSIKKLNRRGFNQAEFIALAVAREFGLVLQNSILTRVLDTKAQYHLGKKGRRKNLQGAFRVTTQVRGLKVLLVDDICTSGATFTEASQVLYKAGAKEVKCFALTKA